MTIRTEKVHDDEPSRHVLPQRDVFVQTLPFIVVAVAATLSLAIPPGPVSYLETAISVILLALTAGAFFLPWKSLPDWTDLIIPLLYLGSALFLILATGGSSEGVSLIVLLPILWAALNLQLWKSLVVVLAMAAVELITSFVPVDVTDAVRLRRLLIYFFFGALISFSIHELRTRITRIGAQRQALNDQMSTTIGELNEANHVTSVMSSLVEQLNDCDSVEEARALFCDCAQELFGSGGSISFLNPQSGLLEVKCRWHGFQGHHQLHSPDQGDALGQERPDEADLETPFREHVREESAPHAICYPLRNLRETVGVLTVSFSDVAVPSPNNFGDEVHTRQYALRLSEQISIWMSNFSLRENLRNLSIRDPLTNLFNRRFMVETLDREINVATRNREQTSVIQIDVDHFKDFNDTFGHQVGDSVLRAVADVMLSLFRDSDVPCRSGGEEFTLILPRCSWETAESRTTQLQALVAKVTIPEAGGVVPPKPPTLSIGIATSPENGTSAEDLLRAADMALYVAKSAGRNRIVRASVAPHETALTFSN